MIDRNHPLSLSKQAKLLDISRSSVYYRPRPTSEADLALMRILDEMHLEHPFMGSRQLARQLRKRGYPVGRVHVRTLMRTMGIQALAPQPGTSKRNPLHKVYPYLLRKLAIVRSNQVWALDSFNGLAPSGAFCVCGFGGVVCPRCVSTSATSSSGC